MHLGVWSWSRQSPGLQTECQNEKERWFKQFWAWNCFDWKKHSLLQRYEARICEATTHTTLRRMSYNCRRPHTHWVLLQIRKRLQFARAHQNWTVENWKNVAWSDESRFPLRHSDGRVRIWREMNENMDPSCLFTTVEAAGGGVMVWLVFFWHTLRPLCANWASFKCHSLPEHCF